MERGIGGEKKPSREQQHMLDYNRRREGGRDSC